MRRVFPYVTNTKCRLSGFELFCVCFFLSFFLSSCWWLIVELSVLFVTDGLVLHLPSAPLSICSALHHFLSSGSSLRAVCLSSSLSFISLFVVTDHVLFLAAPLDRSCFASSAIVATLCTNACREPLPAEGSEVPLLRWR